MENTYKLNCDIKTRITADISSIENLIATTNLTPNTSSDSLDLIKSSLDEIAYVVDLNRWNIIQGTFGKPPYDISEWKIAYNNLIGFNSAITYAKDNGLNRIIVPKGVYSFCYTNLNGGSVFYEMINTPIRLYSNQTLDLNGSTFEVMYDSINKNPYDKSPISTPAWKLSGKFIEIYDCYNTHVVNGTIIGDIPNRSFSDSGTGFNSEKGMEQTYGVTIDNGSSFCSTQNLNISMFMGDGIIIGSYPTKLGTWNISGSNTVAYPGYADVGGVIIKKDGAYISNKFPILSGEHNEIQMRTGGGYTRIPSIANPTFQYLFYNSSDALLSRKASVYLQTVTVPVGTSYVRIQFVNEAIGLSSLAISYAITKPQCNHIEISKCIIHDNHRGGISGGADFTNIEYNKIFHNGMDSSLNIPLFPDSTRYAVNFEDSYSNYVLIKNNEIYSGFYGLLLGAYHVKITENYFTNIEVSGVSIYNNANTIIDCNIFYNTSPLGLSPCIATQERNITLTNNTVTCYTMGLTTVDKTRIRILNNKFYIDNMFLTGDIDVIDNHFKSYLGSKNLDYLFMNIRVTTCINNIFEDYSYGSHYRVSLVKFNAGSSNKNNIFRSVAFNSVSSTNDIEIDTSEFYNCSIAYPTKDKTKDFKISFNNCRLEDTIIELGHAYINDVITGGVTTSVLLNSCNIKMTKMNKYSNFVSILDNKIKTTLNQGVQPRKYESIFTDCLIENSIISKLTLLLGYGNGYVDILIPKKIIMDRCKLNVTDSTRFNLFCSTNVNCTDNIAILKNVTYDGFISFPTPKFGKLEVYNEILTPSGIIPPSSLELRVGTCWFNTTTKKPYWWDGTAWKDATGTAI